MRRTATFVALAVCGLTAASAPARAEVQVYGRGISKSDVLYYGGDPRFPGGGANQENAAGGHRFSYRVYESVEAATPWRITGFYAHMGGDVPADTSVTRADYEVRRKMGPNDLGEVVASGTAPATLVHLGPAERTRTRFRSPPFYQAFRLEVTLPVAATVPAGLYWVAVVPHTQVERGQLYLRDSFKGNGVRALNDHAAFRYSRHYRPNDKPVGPTPMAGDFSLGVLGREAYGPPSAFEQPQAERSADAAPAARDADKPRAAAAPGKAPKGDGEISIVKGGMKFAGK